MCFSPWCISAKTCKIQDFDRLIPDYRASRAFSHNITALIAVDPRVTNQAPSRRTASRHTNAASCKCIPLARTRTATGTHIDIEDVAERDLLLQYVALVVDAQQLPSVNDDREAVLPLAVSRALQAAAAQCHRQNVQFRLAKNNTYSAQ